MTEDPATLLECGLAVIVCNNSNDTLLPARLSKDEAEVAEEDNAV